VPPPDPDLRAREEAEEEVARALRARRFWAAAQAGGIAFLAVTSLGLLPNIVSRWFPALGPLASVVVWIAAPAISITLLVVFARRLPR